MKQLMADNNVSTRQELEDMGYATTGDLEPIENFYLDPTGITFIIMYMKLPHT